MKVLQLRTNKGTGNMGNLSFFEGNKDIPFAIKRVYFTYGASAGVIRGGHAHRSLQQMLFCPIGKIEVVLDNGVVKEAVCLDSPEKGLLVENGVWRDLYWQEDNSVLCVVASDYYAPDDYIRNYEEFMKLVKAGYWDEN